MIQKPPLIHYLHSQHKYIQKPRNELQMVPGGFAEPNHVYNMNRVSYMEPPGPKYSDWSGQ